MAGDDFDLDFFAPPPPPSVASKRVAVTDLAQADNGFDGLELNRRYLLVRHSCLLVPGS